LWPEIDGPTAAEGAMRHGSAAAASFAAFTMLAVQSPYSSFALNSSFGLILAGFWVALAWGISQASRVAACAGLGLYLGSLLLAWLPMLLIWSTVPAALFFTLAFANGIRGAFAVHQYRAGTGSAGSTSL